LTGNAGARIFFAMKKARALSKVTPKPAKREPPQGRREAAKLDKRERIQRAAWELFTTAGYDETTTKEIAARADVAAGTVFLYARDKPDLLCLVMHDRLASAVDAGFATLRRGEPLLEQLMHVFRGVFHQYGEHPAVAAAFISVFPTCDGPNGQRVRAFTFAFLHQVAQLVRDAQKRGEVAADVEPMLAATNVFSLYYGALVAWISGFVTLEAALDPALRASLALQIRGLRP
jgi:AcrR family transcriptional regulator